jgi:tetratricopeptide (TPR) repeat protein
LAATLPAAARTKAIPPPPALVATGSAIDHYNTGAALHARGETAAAIEAYRQALRLNPRHYDSHFNLGAALWDLDQHDEAIAELLEANRLAPQRPEAIEALIRMYQWLENPAEANRFTDKLAALHQGSQPSPEAHRAAADRLVQQGLQLARQMSSPKLWQAIKIFDQALKQDPTHTDTLAAKSLSLSWIANQGKQISKPNRALQAQAQQFAAKAFASHAQSSLAHVAMAYSLYLQGQPKWAVYAQSAGRLDPKNAFAHWIDGLRLEQARQDQAAWAAYRKAIRLDPDQAVFHAALGQALDRAGRYGEAEKALQTAARLAPAYGEAHTALGYAHLHQGHWKPAIAAFQKAIVHEPANSLNHSALALACFADDQANEALSHCQKAISIDKQQAENHYRYARILHDLGSNVMADTEYRQAIALDPRSTTYRQAYEQFRKAKNP